MYNALILHSSCTYVNNFRSSLPLNLTKEMTRNFKMRQLTVSNLIMIFTVSKDTSGCQFVCNMDNYHGFRSSTYNMVSTFLMAVNWNLNVCHFKCKILTLFIQNFC